MFIKRLTALILTLCMALPLGVGAYDIVNLPESMPLSEAMGIFDSTQITYATISDVEEGKFFELSRGQIENFYKKAEGMTVYRTINPTPFRGTAINLYSDNGVMSYYPASGVQIGLYGENNYICYKAKDEDDAYLTIIDSMYRDAQTTAGEEIHRNTVYDFLKLPTQPWAIPYIQNAAAKSILPYPLTSRYGGYISREEFCMIVGQVITVLEGYPSLESYVEKTKGAYLKNVFNDCIGRDESIDMLYALGVVTGKSETTFDPDATLTREEAAVIIMRAAQLLCYVGVVNSTNTFSDKKFISEWAKYAVTWVSEKGIMNGVENNMFDPTSAYTVEQAITTVDRLYDYVASL